MPLSLSLVTNSVLNKARASSPRRPGTNRDRRRARPLPRVVRGEADARCGNDRVIGRNMRIAPCCKIVNGKRESDGSRTRTVRRTRRTGPRPSGPRGRRGRRARARIGCEPIIDSSRDKKIEESSIDRSRVLVMICGGSPPSWRIVGAAAEASGRGRAARAVDGCRDDEGGLPGSGRSAAGRSVHRSSSREIREGRPLGPVDVADQPRHGQEHRCMRSVRTPRR